MEYPLVLSLSKDERILLSLRIVDSSIRGEPYLSLTCRRIEL